MIETLIHLREIHKIFEESDSLLQQTIGKPTCISNCGKCCELNIPQAMTIEAINAVSVFTGKGKLKELISIAEGWLLETDKNLKIYEGLPEGQVSPVLRDEWSKVSRGQCPFLTEDKRCFIHEVRPLTCRAYGVMRDAADICPRPTGLGETQTQRTYINDSEGLLRRCINEFKSDCDGKNKDWTTYGSIPTLIFRCAKQLELKLLASERKIPSAKLIGLKLDTSLMWQPQVEAIRSGLPANEVARMR